MDKKSTVNDLYQAAVISVLAVGYSMSGKKIPAHDSSQHSKIRSGRHGKIGCHRSCIRNDQKVSHQTEDLARSHKHIRKWRV